MKCWDGLMNYNEKLKLGKEDAYCRYGDKMYIVRLREEPLFIGYFCGRVKDKQGTFYAIQVKNAFGRIECYLPGCVKSEKELELDKIHNNLRECPPNCGNCKMTKS